MNTAVQDLPMANTMLTMDTGLVRQQFAQARSQGLRAKEAAQQIGLPEGAAIAAHAPAHEGPLQAMPLKAQWLALLQGLQACGPLMALTRNESTVHEKTGIYSNVSATGPVGLALSREIDLRLFFAQWHAGYAVTEAPANAGNPPTRSLQFFNAQGRAIHKIYVREHTDVAAFDALVQRFAEPAADYVFLAAAPPKAVVQADATIDVAGLTAAWAAMQDTHEFFDMLRRFGAERQQALRLVQGDYCERLAPAAVTALLEEAAVDSLHIMVFVGSGGCIQIHTGPVANIQPLEVPNGARWINVMDPGFNLHLRTDMIDAVWKVEKPTADGVVTSVEVFDKHGELMAMFFGERKPGQAELQGWRELLARLPRPQAAAQEVLA